MKIDVWKIPQNAPDDLTALEQLIQAQQIDPRSIIAVMGKTEGNGCVNDFTRGFAVQSLQFYLRSYLTPEAIEQIIFVMSGGTEGILSPHLTVFTRQQVSADTPPNWGLVLGTSQTRNFLPAEIGTITMVEVVAEGVRQAIADAGLTIPEVHFVQIKCPLLNSSRTQGEQVQTQDSYKSMAYSRAASALGVALALGEITPAQLQPSDICHNYHLYSAVASTSAGVELQNCEILVFGNSPHSHSDLLINHSVMDHALDGAAVREAIEGLKKIAGIDGSIEIINVFAKAEADPTGQILGQRHTMLDDSDISHTRMARAVVGAVIASIVQDPMIYVSGGSEHQGPAGGGPIAVIGRVR